MDVGTNYEARSRIAGWRRLSTSLLVALLLLCIPLAQAQGKGKKDSKASANKSTKETRRMPDTWYVSSIARSERGTVVVHYWSKGPLFRAETIISGHQVVSIVDRDTYYVYDGARGFGAAIGRHPNAIQEDKERGRSFGMELEELLAQGGERISGGILKQSNVEFELYQVTNKLGRTQVAITTTEPRLPFRVETFIRSKGETTVLEYAGWQRGITLNDTFFEPPSQVVLERYSYEEYVTALSEGSMSNAPVYYGHLLHGTRPD